MARITQKQLETQIRMLKEIKPNREWVSLLKSEVMGQSQTKPIMAESALMSFGLFGGWKRNLAYSLAAMVMLIVGIFGFARYTVPGDLLFPVRKLAEQSQADLAGQTPLRQNINNLSNRVNDLAEVAKAGRKDNIPSAISEINQNASVLAKSLKTTPIKDSADIKQLAEALKTLANVPGTDLSVNPDVKDLYQTVVENQLADFQKITLTDEQKVTLQEAQDLYTQGKYTDALEKLLLIGK